MLQQSQVLKDSIPLGQVQQQLRPDLGGLDAAGWLWDNCW